MTAGSPGRSPEVRPAGTGGDNLSWVHPAGSRASGGFDCVIDQSVPDWRHTGLQVATVRAGESVLVALPGDEAVVVPLTGGPVTAHVADVAGAGTYRLTGRPDVFSGPTDVLYVPVGAGVRLEVHGQAAVRVAVCRAAVAPTSAQPRSVRHLPAAEVPVEVRGAGIATRQVRNFGVPGVLDAERIIACEVVTAAGNWSSWPPHKHDEHRAGLESELEEIYWVDVQSTDPRGVDPFGYLRVYGTSERPIDVVAEVRTGDVVLVPHGWHGPAIATPNADLYYLNVMAGPGPERAWLICDDPAHGWVRQAWADQPPDPRVS